VSSSKASNRRAAYDDDDYDIDEDEDNEEEYDVEEEDEDDESDSSVGAASKFRRFLEKRKRMTEHSKIINTLKIDYSNVDFTNDDETTVAAYTVDAIAEDMLRYGRLETLFGQTKTAECRALIAEHFGYFIKSIATESPLPFANIRYRSTCPDEQYWDFHNLPTGVHMGVSRFIFLMGGFFPVAV
jgi:hypothetical protein